MAASSVALFAPASAAALPFARQPPSVQCVRYLTPNRTWTYDPISPQVNYRQIYATDALGRPVRALAAELLKRRAPRNSCTTTVGRWGPAGYQGGHLIAARFTGPSERYNLFPVQGNQINQGIMSRIEDEAAQCLRRTRILNYEVRLTYPAPPNADVVPERIRIRMEPQVLVPPQDFDIEFDNQAMTRTAYTALSSQVQAQFRASGC